ncbi:MAG: TolC family protein [Giesbergeria sp.]|uniref:TolC family protein n=1 Tax=Giesbergeria sp. TaxID=2818473 RepID=UPI0026350268|nr:TolC family protein [Giesbergeria sp.]MDD2610170.1 TolC family protein [Giesbergeria sp.]
MMWHFLPALTRRWRWGAGLLCLSAAGSVLAQTAPDLLPSSPQVMQVLQQLPAVQMAKAGLPLAQARSQRLQAGPHEWSAQITLNRRNDLESQQRFTEPEISLETPVRWPGKAAADRQLGATEISLGALAYADAWHEAARSLLNDWFDTLRDLRSANLLEAQSQLVSKQLGNTERRVQAGEAAQLELQAARAEQARIQAQSMRARLQADTRVQTFQRLYPGLALPTDSLPTAPAARQTTADTPEPSLAAAVEQILADNHELELAQAKAQQAQQQAQRASLEQQADPTVGVRAARERGGQERVWGVYLSIPLGRAGRQADYQAALAQADIAQHELHRTRQRVEAAAWQVASAVAQTKKVNVQLQQALEQMQRSAALQARAYELGESELNDVLLAQRSALEALLAADAAALEATQAQARWQLDTHQLWSLPHPATH